MDKHTAKSLLLSDTAFCGLLITNENSPLLEHIIDNVHYSLHCSTYKNFDKYLAFFVFEGNRDFFFVKRSDLKHALFMLKLEKVLES